MNEYYYAIDNSLSASDRFTKTMVCDDNVFYLTDITSAPLVYPEKKEEN